VLVSVCVALTILIVTLARDRTSGPQAAVPVMAAAASAPIDLRPVPTTGSTVHHDAAASRGGHR
jgi:hypothetical protein